MSDTRIAITIKVETLRDGPISRSDFHAAHSCKLEDMQAVVGGNIEAVHLNMREVHTLGKLYGFPALPAQMIMYANEEGTYKRLPFNLIATAMAGHDIVGDVIIIEVKPEDYGGGDV